MRSSFVGKGAAAALAVAVVIAMATSCTTFGADPSDPFLAPVDAGPGDQASPEAPDVMVPVRDAGPPAPVDAACLSAPDSSSPRAFFWAFVSADVFTGKLGTVFEADQYCTRVGTAALGGVRYRAYLMGAPPEPAGAKFVGKGPWRLPSGEVVFDSQGDFAGGPRTPLARTADGCLLSPAAPSLVWTGMSPDNTAGSACDNWDKTETGRSASVGDARQMGARWHAGQDIPCSASARLYCLEVER